MNWSSVWLVIFSYYGVTCAPTLKSKYPQLPSIQVLDFMKRFGYIEDDHGDSEALYTEEGVSDIIKNVQRFGALKETGIVDNDTLKLMSSPRCGVPDILKKHRQKRYVLGPAGWEKRNITYFLANWTPKLDENTVAKNIQVALELWGGYGRLSFQRVYSPNADIIVAFARGYHGDSFPFDGSGNILAHAFFPYEFSDLGGDIHFDDDENWTDKGKDGVQGTDFFTVALHELGHSLGLAHSPVPTSVMFPYYKGTETNTDSQLGYDDILAMYKLYISRELKEDNNTPYRSETEEDTPYSSSTITSYTESDTSSRVWTSTTTEISVTTTTSRASTHSEYSTTTYEGDSESVEVHKNHDETHHIPKTNTPSFPDICSGHVDAVATLRDELFVFKNQYIWRYREKGKLERNYPVPLREMFNSLPETIVKIDAAYERADGMIILFTGKIFWVYDGTNFVEGSPKSLTYYGLPSYLDSVDAVQTWKRNKKTYFYKNDRFWRYNETAKSMDAGYPLHIERWRGVPEHLDAATTWKDGATYFFKNDLFWKFDNDWVITTEESPFPTAQIWFGCPEEPMKWV